jgi:hypothetical protein
MFRFLNFKAYVSLQVPISIDESIQPLVIIRGTIFAITNLVINVPSGRESDGIESVEEIVANYGNDG